MTKRATLTRLALSGSSLRWRLIFILFTTLCSGLIAAMLFFYWEAIGTQTGLRERSLQEQAREILAAVEVDARGVPRLPQNQRLNEAYARSASGYGYTFFDRRGSVKAISASRASEGPLPLAQIPPKSEQFGPVYFAGPNQTAVMTARAEDGRYFLAVSRQDPDTKVLAGSLIEQDALPLLALLPFVLISFALIVVVINRTLRPLQQASQEASSIGPTSLVARVRSRGLPVEIVPLVAAFNGALDRLSKAYQVEKRLTADAAHELRTPIAVLQMRLERARSPLASASDWEMVDRDLANLRRLVAQLLDLARKEQGMHGDVGSVNLSRVAREAAAQMLPLAETAGRTLEIDAPRPVLLDNASEEDLRDAARNLIENALIHGAGDVLVQVRQHSDKARVMAELSVEDEGAGISQELKERVFERFVKGNEAKPGAGLGLAIVRHVAQAHGGSAEVQDHPASRIAMMLPADCAEAEAVA